MLHSYIHSILLLASTITITALSTVTTLQSAEGNATSGKAHFAVCAACHGANGEGLAALKGPRLAGQEAWYLKAQLTKFRDGQRGADPKDIFGMQMAPMAKTLANDQAVDDVVAYVTTLKTDIAKDATTGGDASKGKAAYAICATCHGDKAQGLVALKGPKLNDQHSWYLLQQLKNFKTGVRGSHPKDMEGALMKPMAAMLADEQAMKDVIAYIESMK